MLHMVKEIMLAISLMALQSVARSEMKEHINELTSATSLLR